MYYQVPIYRMEGKFGGGKRWQIWQMTINSPNQILNIISILKHSYMEYPQLDERLQSVAVVAHSHAPFCA